MTTPFAVGALLLSLLAGQAAAAPEVACPLPGQKQMLVVQLFFGQSVKDRRPVSDKEWRSFLARAVTPRFPDGFTVYDGYGQWMNPQTQSIGREKTKVVVIATEDTPALRTRIEELSGIYRTRFHQHSVGLITSPGCAVF
jgi:Protein of unknown function (DUF3574)